mmetsp:Transcript_10782/g.21636  ORF Transcript_10782/g.21636 Transcript_10782/m.21636 type:complete len:261 (+) Transcript_10782:116-898(+)
MCREAAMETGLVLVDSLWKDFVAVTLNWVLGLWKSWMCEVDGTPTCGCSVKDKDRSEKGGASKVMLMGRVEEGSNGMDLSLSDSDDEEFGENVHARSLPQRAREHEDHNMQRVSGGFGDEFPGPGTSEIRRSRSFPGCIPDQEEDLVEEEVTELAQQTEINTQLNRGRHNAQRFLLLEGMRDMLNGDYDGTMKLGSKTQKTLSSFARGYTVQLSAGLQLLISARGGEILFESQPSLPQTTPKRETQSRVVKFADIVAVHC